MKKLLAILVISSVLSLNSCGELLKLTTLQEAKVFVGSIKGYKDGIGEQAQFNSIYTDAIDKDGNIYIGDCEANAIRKVSPDGKVTTFLKSKEKSSIDGKFETATFECPRNLLIDENDSLYFQEKSGVRKIANNEIITILKEEENKLLNQLDLYSIMSQGDLFFLDKSMEFSTFTFHRMKLDKKIESTTISNKINLDKSMSFLSFNKKTNDLYLESYKLNELPQSFGLMPTYPRQKQDKNIESSDYDKSVKNNLEIYKFNLDSKKITKIPILSSDKDEYFSNSFVIDSNNYIYTIIKDKVVKFTFDLKYKKEIISLKTTQNKTLGYRPILNLDEKRKLLYIYESSDYKRIYKVNIE